MVNVVKNNVIKKFRIKKDIEENSRLFQEQIKAMEFGSKEANEIVDYCKACCSRMLKKYADAYARWIEESKPIFAQMKLNPEQQLMMLKRQAAKFLAVSLTDQYHLYGDVNELMKQKNTKWVQMVNEYQDVYEGIDKKFPNLFNRIEEKRKNKLGR